MAPKDLPKDATIASVLEKVNKPAKYLQMVLEHMAPCRKQHGNASVRIGITGTGWEPSHWVVYHDANGAEKTVGAFGGKVPFTEVNLHPDRWSTVAMTFEDVHKLLDGMHGLGAVKHA